MTDDIGRGAESFFLAFPVVQSSMLSRDRPAESEGDAALWRLPREVIDFGCALIDLRSPPSGTSRIQDLVVDALLRRILVVAEGIDVLLRKGLVDAARALFRTMLDAELNLKLVVADPTGRMALRLAAYHYRRYQLHGQRAAANREVRERRNADGGPDPAEIARSYARFLESPVFDDVRADVLRDHHWHGLPSVEEAFKKAHSQDDYVTLYDLFSYFAHASNVEADYIALDAGQPTLKPLVERDFAINRTLIQNLAIRLLATLHLYVEARGLPTQLKGSEGATSKGSDGGTTGTLNADALQGLYVSVAERLGLDVNVVYGWILSERR